MSKEVDALIIIGHSHLIASEAPLSNHESIGMGLQFIENGSIKWADGTDITEDSKTELFAGDVFLKLGYLAASCYSKGLEEQQFIQQPLIQLPLEKPRLINPFVEEAVNVFDDISPFDNGEFLPEELVIKHGKMKLNNHGLPVMFNKPLEVKPSIESELKEKWEIAQQVHTKRGSATIKSFNLRDVVLRLSESEVKNTAPDFMELDENNNFVGFSRSVDNLIKATGAESYLKEVPYYQTFGNSRHNELEMLKAAFEDLRLVRKKIS